MNTVHFRIKSMLKAYKWSAPRLAEYSGVPLASIKSILYGQSKNPRAETLQALAAAFHCPISELMKAPEAPVVVATRLPTVPLALSSASVEEALVKGAIVMLEDLAITHHVNLSDERKALYVEKLLAFAAERAHKTNQVPKIDVTYARWLIKNNS